MGRGEDLGAGTGAEGRGAGREGGDWRGGARVGRARGVDGRGGGTRGGAAAGARRGGWGELPDATGGGAGRGCGAGLVCLLLFALRSLLPSALRPVLGVGPKSISSTSTTNPLSLTNLTLPKSSTSGSFPRPPSLSELSPAPISFPTACIARFEAIFRRWTGGTAGTRISSSEDSSSDARSESRVGAALGKAKKGAGAAVGGGGRGSRGERS